MRKSILVFTMLIMTQSIFGQTVFPPGVYGSLENLLAGQPDFQTSLYVVPVEGNGFNGPVNEFKLNSDSLGKYFLRTKVFAYVRDSTVFINCEKIDRFKGFAESKTMGNFLVFRSPNVQYTGEGIVVGAVLGGVVGAAIGAAVEAGKEKPPYWGLYVLSLRTGNVRKMTEEYLYARLQDHPKLRRAHSKGNYADDDESLIRFMQLINDKIDSE